MNKEKLIKFFLSPKPFFIVLTYIITVIFIALSLTLVIIGYDKSLVLEIVSYLSFAVSAICLTYATYLTVKLVPKIKNAIIKVLNKRTFTKKILQNYGFRTLVFACGSFIFSILYGVYNGVIAILSLTLWYGALAGYYILISFMRGGVFLYHGRRKKSGYDKLQELNTYKNCGILLMIIITALSVAVAQMVATGVAFEYGGLLIYVAATYSFLKMTTAIINVIKARGHESLTVRAIRSINFADALVSLFALQTALLTTFSDGTGITIANILMGAIVCSVIFGIGLFMTVKAIKEKKKV
ncbi:MAG: hypothetical protein IJX16_02100 [Clostridia bacterium]|nr:hypothetical protein [Clostridia bacterium]